MWFSGSAAIKQGVGNRPSGLVAVATQHHWRETYLPLLCPRDTATATAVVRVLFPQNKKRYDTLRYMCVIKRFYPPDETPERKQCGHRVQQQATKNWQTANALPAPTAQYSVLRVPSWWQLIFLFGLGVQRPHQQFGRTKNRREFDTRNNSCLKFVSKVVRWVVICYLLFAAFLLWHILHYTRTWVHLLNRCDNKKQRGTTAVECGRTFKWGLPIKRDGKEGCFFSRKSKSTHSTSQTVLIISHRKAVP